MKNTNTAEAFRDEVWKYLKDTEKARIEALTVDELRKEIKEKLAEWKASQNSSTVKVYLITEIGQLEERLKKLGA